MNSELLSALRSRINAADAAIAQAISDRQEAAGEIGRLKADTGLSIYIPGREASLLEARSAQAPLENRTLVTSVLRLLIAASRQKQLALQPAKPIHVSRGVRAVRKLAAGEDTETAALEMLSACLAAGIAPKSLASSKDEITLELPAVCVRTKAAAEHLCADLSALGAELEPCCRPGEGLVCGLLGQSLGHTLSPAIHAELAGYGYQCFEIEPDALGNFLMHEPFDGINVTIPYKQAAMPWCARLTDAAQRIGAVNTIVREPDGTLAGDNTDYAGFRAAVEKSGIQPAGKTALILGRGGAAQCVRAVLEDMGAHVRMISVRGAEGEAALRANADAELLINATPVGMFPYCGISPVSDLSIFSRLEAVFDLIYNPSVTELMRLARARGIPAYNGLLMLAVQAEAASRAFLRGEDPEADAESVWKKLARESENIVLIGMPGSGKTTVGRIIAKRLGKPFIDLDAQIEAAAGISIPEFFRLHGEPLFRNLESQLAKEAGARRGVVIATGGGTVMRADNSAALGQNGKLALLLRPLSELPSDGRPVSQSRSMEALWKERRATYEACADVQVHNTTPEEAAEAILRAFGRC